MENIHILSFIILVIIVNITMSLFNKKSNTLYCGIVGFSGPGKFDKNIIKFLMYWNSIERGLDATGFFTKESGIVKDNVSADKFFADTKSDKLQPTNLLIGHVRAKTIGINTIKNAHPFDIGNLIGVHNGTLKNHYEICRNYNISINKYDVDSQILYHALNEDFEKETPFKILNSYVGAAALLFYDKKSDCLYACHDEQRPLYYGYLKGNMYISSIKESLIAVDCVKVKEFPINTIHKIKDGKILETTVFKNYNTNLNFGYVATSNDIKYLNGKYSISGTPKGINSIDFLPEHAIGFNVFIDYVGNDVDYKHLCKWYTVVEKNTKDKYRNGMIVKNLQGETFTIRGVNIRTDNFIPVKGGLVKLTTDLVKTNTKESVGSENDTLYVLNYKYGDSVLSVINIYNGEKFNVCLEHVRNLISSERADGIQELVNYRSGLKAKDEKIEHFKNIVISQPEEYESSPFAEEELFKIEDDGDDYTLVPLPFVKEKMEDIKVELIKLQDLKGEDLKNKIKSLTETIDKYSYDGAKV